MISVAENANKPFVTVVVPVRNEAEHIEQCVRSVLESDYPTDRLEVLVVDGMSDDSTLEIVRRMAAEDDRLRLLENPARVVPHAMNLGIRESCGEIVCRVDGHATVAKDFITRGVRALREHPEAWCVGGAIETVSTNFTGRAISAAMSTPVGVGNARFRLGNYTGYVDTVAFGCYWRWVFDRIGMFDEELVCNEDDDFNQRLIEAGGKIWMDSRIRSSYYSRRSLRKLARQYVQYGFWRIRTIQKHGRPATLRQIAPMVFVCLWIVLVVGTVFWWPLRYALAGYAALYGLGLLFGVLDVARKTGLRYALAAPLAVMAMHFGYGLGSLRGLVRFVILRRGPPSPETHRLSR